MNIIRSVDPAPIPGNQPAFLVDWMITKFCNLNCSYCDSYNHDNFSKHPDFTKTTDTIDFIYEYVDLYMTYKKSWQKNLVLNIYGGEGMIHPNIVEILNQVKLRHKQYQDKWPLTVLVTTNGVFGENLLKKVIDYVDSWTISFHTESLKKQQTQALNNAKLLKDQNKQVRCVIMMNPEKWDMCLDAIEFCREHNIDFTPKTLDTTGAFEENYVYHNKIYSKEQMEYIKSFWVAKSSKQGKELIENSVQLQTNNEARDHGRACCGNRSLCINQDFKNRVSAVPLKNFTNWYCSVNWYFLHVNQHTGEIYNNKDCRTSLRNLIEPVGYLNDTRKIINEHKSMLENKTMPVIKCINKSCNCGTCAPKAVDADTFKSLMKNHWVEDRTIIVR
jgi:MoaA/NifB/PqqE/SkfB family radical SAM enzyme